MRCALCWLKSLQDKSRTAQSVVQPFRVLNTYHLFGHITRERIEPEVQVARPSKQAQGWQTLSHFFKPGPVERAGVWSIPHQPRLDFQLWFYGLSFRRATPRYIKNLNRRLCQRPKTLTSIFRESLHEPVKRLRWRFWRYRFTSPETFAKTGKRWRRTLLHTGPEISCKSISD